MIIYNLRCESMENPIGISITKPRLTWNLRSEKRGVYQKAFRVTLEREIPGQEGSREQIFDSGPTEKKETAYILDETVLESSTRYFWNVEVTDQDGKVWKAPQDAWFEMGLLHVSDWKAKWIEPEQTPVYREEWDIAKEMPFLRTFENGTRRWLHEPELDNYVENGSVQSQEIQENILYPCPMLRKRMNINGKVSRARLYATAHGIYRMEINGKRVGDYEFAPEVTSYADYLQVQTYDVTELLETGENVLGMALSDGWWAGRIGFSGESARFGNMLGALVQLQVIYEDEREEIIGSDHTFVSTTDGPRRYADLFIGEKYDCSREIKNWSKKEFDDSSWKPVNEVDYGYDTLAGQNAQHIKILETIQVQRIYQSPKGEQIIDFGQAMAGTARMHLKGESGAVVTLKYFEEPDKDGNYRYVITGNNSQMIDTVVLDAKGEADYDPWFTYHGYRYICIGADKGEVEPTQIVGRLIGSDVQVLTHIDTSNPKLNQLQKNIEWTLRSNMMSILTDNPDRERSGWTGDMQMIAPTVCYNLDVEANFRRWMEDLKYDQGEHGEIPAVIPYFHNGNTEMNHSTPGWGDVAVMLPWHMYQKYGDKRILEDYYPAMKKWLELEKYRAESANPVSIGEVTPERAPYLKYIWNADWSFGDWITPSACTDKETGRMVLGPLVLCNLTGTYYYAYSTETLSKIAEILGKTEDAKMYRELNRKIREAAVHELYNRGQILESPYMGAQILALHMHLYPEMEKGKLFERIMELVKKNGMDAGFSSALVLPEILCENGKSAQMYEFLLNEQCPSWLYEVDQGATTVWEAMQAVLPNGERGDCSYIQPAYCSIGNWMIEGMCGISAAEPGFKTVKIRPYFTERLEHAGAEVFTEQGLVTNRWERKGGAMIMDTEIPANTNAEIFIENASMGQLKESKGDLNGFEGLLKAEQKEGGVLLHVSSGKYRFYWNLNI